MCRGFPRSGCNCLLSKAGIYSKHYQVMILITIYRIAIAFCRSVKRTFIYATIRPGSRPAKHSKATRLYRLLPLLPAAAATTTASSTTRTPTTTTDTEVRRRRGRMSMAEGDRYDANANCHRWPAISGGCVGAEPLSSLEDSAGVSGGCAEGGEGQHCVGNAAWQQDGCPVVARKSA